MKNQCGECERGRKMLLLGAVGLQLSSVKLLQVARGKVPTHTAGEEVERLK